MSIFRAYSNYYNLLYGDKDYEAESRFVLDWIRHYTPCAKTVLDLGCGTGIHAYSMSKHGMRVCGIDLSSDMLNQAILRHDSSFDVRPEFMQGDIRSIRMDRTFDAVVSLFHVMSYQTTNDDVLAALMTAKSHLKPGGVFLFDCWYGPAVLSLRPEVRVKHYMDERVHVTRIAEPEMHSAINCVDVNYTLFVKDKRDQKIEEHRESHKMRYFFETEIDMLCTQVGFTRLAAFEWMSGECLNYNTWNACFVVRL